MGTDRGSDCKDLTSVKQYISLIFNNMQLFIFKFSLILVLIQPVTVDTNTEEREPVQNSTGDLLSLV